MTTATPEMLSPFATTQRTHLCGDLRAADVGTRVKLGGWVHRSRNLGGLVFTIPFARTLFDLAPLTPPLFATGAGVFVAVIVTLFLARFAVYGRARSIR